MFEAIVALCIGGGPCRDSLVPGYEAETQAGCEAALAAAPPDPARLPADMTAGKAACRPAGPALAVTEVAPGIFIHRGLIEEPDLENRGDVSNLGFIIGDDSVAVIDTGGARWIGEALWRAIRARTDKPLRYVILTHPHPDHVFGAEVFAPLKPELVANAGFARALSDRQANYVQGFTNLIGDEALFGKLEMPVTLGVSKPIEIDLGHRLLRLQSWPPAHTIADLSVIDEKTDTLLAGDLVFDRHAPALDGSLLGWERVLAALKKTPVARIVPGHGGPVLPWPEGLAPMIRYLHVLETDTRKAVEAGEHLGDAVGHIASSEAGNWALFDQYNARNATVAFTEIEWE